LKVEVTNISAHGFWILVEDKEYFLSYEHFPWFKDRSVKEIVEVRCFAEGHLYWEDIDVDLSLEMIENPQRFPLKAV